MKCTPGFLLFTLLIFIQSSLSGQYSGGNPYCGDAGTLMINEISQGPSGGNFEYIELVVLGAPSDPTSDVDLSNWIIDDNNHIGSGTGNEAGHIRFSSCYSAVAPGSILVIYNNNERNTNLPPDDPSDANGDNVYIIPHNDPCLNVCLSNPNQNTDDPSYCPCLDPSQTSNAWITQMNNSNDLIQVRNQCENIVHVLGWGLSVVDVEDDVLTAPVTLLSSFANIGEQVINFSNGDWSSQANFSLDPVSTNETPGAPNSAANATFIMDASNGTTACGGAISVACDLSSAGKLVVPSDANQASSGDTIYLCEGSDLSEFITSYDDPNDMPPPGGGPFNYLYAYFLTSADPPYTFINNPPLAGISVTGDFNFSNLPVGTYRVWGVSLLIENLFAFLTTQSITNIQDLLDYVECAYDVDVTNLDNQPSNGEVIIKIIPEPDPIPGFTIDTCASDTLQNGTVVVDINYYDFNDLVIVTGNPSIHWYFDVDTTFSIPNAVIGQEAQTVYVVADYGGCRTTPTPIILNLNPPSDASWSAPTDPICRNGSNFDLDSLVTGELGGTFMGIGVVGEGGSNFRFYPTLASPGEVEIMYTVGVGNCVNTESHILTIAAFPTANSIAPTICSDEFEGNQLIAIVDLSQFNLEINTDPSLEIQWYTDQNLANQIFDIENFEVLNAITIYAVSFDGTCSSEAVAVTITLTFAYANAGMDISTCSTDPIALLADPSIGTWSTLGDGNFDDVNNQSTRYSPGANDISNGTIEIVWTADYNDLACSFVMDTIEISFGASNLAEAGVNQSVCYNSNTMLNGAPENGVWSTEGDGIFVDINDNQTNYQPGPQDNINTEVQLVWTVPDPDGPGPCTSDSDTLVINYFPEITFTCGSLMSPSDETSTDGSIRLSFSGGTMPYACTWIGPVNGDQDNLSGNQYDIENLSQGNYSINLRDANSCEFTCLTSLSSAACPITLELMQIDSIFCFGDTTASLELSINNGSGNYTYDWNIDRYDGMSNLSNLGAGFYAVTVTDTENNCEESANIAIAQVDEILLDCSTIMDVSVPNGTDGQGRITLSGGVEPYQVEYTNSTNGQSGSNTLSNPGTLNLRNLTAGSYNVTIVDGNDCEVNCGFIINQPGCNLTATIDTLGQLICNGDETIQINTSFMNAVEPVNYDWNIDAFDGQDNINNAGAGEYSVVISDANNCIANASITITEPDLLELNCSLVQEASSATAADAVLRFDISGGVQAYDLNITGPRNDMFSITNSNGLQTGGFPIGTYNILIVDALGCEETCIIEVTSVMSCVSDTAFIRELICPGDFIIINGTPYNEANLSGIETIEGGAVNGCDSIIDIELETDLDVQFELEDPNCMDTTLGIIRILEVSNGNGLYEYSLNGGNAWEMVGDFPFEIRIRPGDYNLSVRNTDGDCLFETSVRINNAIINSIGLNPLYVIQEGDSVQLGFTANFTPASIEWSPNINLSCSDCPNPIAFPLTTTAYELRLVDSLGCVFTANTNINVEGIATIFIPNVFSPNGDNINDFFFPESSEEIVNIEELLIFDRWGNLVFAVQNIPPSSRNEGWDGKYKGKMLNPGVFAYWLKVLDSNGVSKLYKGDLTLIR